MSGSPSSERPEHQPSAGVARLAQRKSLWRALNERLSQLTWSELRATGPVDFVCECSRPGCWESVRLTQDQYEGVRAVPGRFLVRPGHELEGVDRIVEQHDEYVVVEPADPRLASVSDDPWLLDGDDR